MRKIKFLFLLCLFCLISIGASAYDFSALNADGVEIYYNITSSTDLTCEVESSTNKYSGIVNIPESVTYNNKTYSVTSIGLGAFNNCTGLTSITIPNSVTSIGNYAFDNCTGLTSVTIGNSVTSIGGFAFYGCSGLTSINIPNSVTSIGSFAFYKCTGLTSLTIPNSVTSIGSVAFIGCSGLASIVVGSENKYYDSRENCNALIETATNDLLTGCKNTIIPNSVTIIRGGAFAYCTGLTSVTIPNSVTIIGGDAFNNCTGLTSVTIPNSVTSIEGYAFAYCTGLTSVTIPNSVTSIGEYAFAYCTGLKSINIPNAVEVIGEYAFSGCTSLPVENNLRYADTYLVEIVDKTTLSAYSIRNGTRFIGERAFQNCVGLTSVTIPISVISIGDDAFSRCSSLEDVFVSRGRPYTISDNVFDTNDKGGLILITLHVPIGKTMVFQLADVWCKFYNIQEWDPSTGIEEIKSQSTVNGQQSTDLYNLQGVKISGQQNRGIVIKNGKKYVVK